MTAEETIELLEGQLKHALERLTEVTELLQVAQAPIAELEKRDPAAARFCQSEQEQSARGTEEGAQKA